MLSRWITSSVVIVFALSLSATSFANTAAEPAADLDRAIKLFDESNYVEAQQVLVGIDRSKLNANNQARRDDYLNRVGVAITMQEKAVRDLEDAELAISNNEKDKGVRLLESVIANEYSGEALRRAAKMKLNDVKGAAPEAGGAAKNEQPVPPPTQPKPGESVQTTTKTTEKVEVISPMAQQPEQPAPPPVRPQDVERARALTLEGDEFREASRYDDALARYEEALALVPGYPEAVAGLQLIADHVANAAPGGRTSDMLTRVRVETEISWQRAVVEYRDAERQIRLHVSNAEFDQANQLLIRARQIVESSKQFAEPVTKYESLRDELSQLEQSVQNDERQYNEQKVRDTQYELERLRKEKIDRVKEERDRQIEALMEQAAQMKKEGDYDGAINTYKQIIVIDPKYKPARWSLDDAENANQYRREKKIRDTMYEQQRGTLIEVEEAKIPWYEQLRYPSDWPEIINKPERSRGGRSRRDALLFGSLDKPIRVDFKREPFENVIERLATANDVNILINWADLERAGVQRDAKIDLNLPKEITLKRALTEAFSQAGKGMVDVGYDVGDGVISVATQETLDRHTYVAVYDIADLLMEVPNFNDAPMSDLRNAEIKRPVLKTSATAQMSEKPWRVGDDDDDEAEPLDPERLDRLKEIMDLIQTNVEKDSWFSQTGKGSMREFNNQLVVTQNSSAQRQIADLLGKLREQRAIQISIEARFLTVSSHYLEELGIDLDIILNAGNAGFDYLPTGGGPLTDAVTGAPVLLPRSFSKIGTTPATPGFGNPLAADPNAGNQPWGTVAGVPQGRGGSGSNFTPVPVSSGISSITDPRNLGSDIPGSFAGTPIPPAFNLFGSFLDNIQVDFLIRATQADSRTTVLTAPRLVLFNGQRSWVAVTIQQNFVSQLTPVVATGAVAQAPQIGTIDAGAVLDVQATVQNDRRYICMTLRPGVTRLLDLQTIPFSGGAGGGGFGGGAANQAFIQIPTLSSQRLQTTVCVPDGGTLLVGGQKLASETEIEAGVPGLSKIPLLKRLYNSRSMVKDEQTLLILVKPKIFIQSEQEESAFPSFGTASAARN